MASAEALIVNQPSWSESEYVLRITVVHTLFTQVHTSSLVPLICSLQPDSSNQSSIDLKMCEDKIKPKWEQRILHQDSASAFHTPPFYTLQLVVKYKGCFNIVFWCFRVKCMLFFVAICCRRDSAVIKEEVKSFLANRRISQAVVAQVTGESHSKTRRAQ